MPRSTASRRRALTVSAPARCPSATDRPRGSSPRPSDLEDLGFLALEQGVELGDPLVGHLLQLDFGAMLVVGADVARVAQLAEVLHRVAPNVADRDAPLLGDVARDLDELAAALLVELGHGEADQAPVVAR